MRSMKKRGFLIAAVLVAAVAVVIGMNIGVKAEEDENLVIADRVYIGDISVAGMTAKEAKTVVEEYVDGLKNTTIKLQAGEKHIEVKAEELGIGWGNPEIAQKAANLGRTGNPIARYKEKKDLEKGDKVFIISYSVDENKVKALLDKNAKALNQKAQNNGLKRENDRFVFVKGHEGIQIKTEESVEQIVSYMQDEWDGKAASVELAAKIVEPKGSKEELAKVKDLLGSFNTNFSSSASGRAMNVRNGASKINGSIVYPGDEFSVHDAVVPFNAENGYALAGSYENGTTVETYGGGICQVSSTLYNAVIRAELDVTERFAHSMIVTYVEPSMDAAISGNYKDLKFKNSTNAPIYIEGYTEGGIIYFNIYGEETRDANREISFVSETLGQTDPGVQFVPDAALPIGALSTTQQAHIGKKAKLWKVVTVNGKEVSREEFNSSTYNPSPKIVNVGIASANAGAVAAVNAAIATQDEATIQAAAAAYSDQALANAAAAQAAAEAAAQAAQAEEAKKNEEEKKDDSKNSEKEDASKNEAE